MTISILQEIATDTGFSVSSITLAYGSNLTAGSSLHACGTWGANVAATQGTFSDNHSGATWSTIATQIGASNQSCSQGKADGAAAGACTVTFTPPATVTFVGIAIREIGGTSGYDSSTATAVLRAAPGTGANAILAGSASPSVQPGLVSCFVVDINNVDGLAAGTGYTLGLANTNWPNIGAIITEHLRYTATSAQQPTATDATSGGAHSYEVLTAFFKETGAGGVTQYIEEPNRRRPGRGPFSKNNFRVSDTTPFTSTIAPLPPIVPPAFEAPNFPRPGRGPFSKGHFYVSDTTAYTFAAGPAAALAGALTDVATATGALSTGIPLAGATQQVASATAALSTGIALAGAAAAIASATAALTTAIKLVTAAQDTVSATAGLTAGIALATTASDLVSATGSLNTAIQLAATAQAVAVASGSLSTAVQLAGTAADLVTVSDALTTAIQLVATAASSSTATGNLLQSLVGIAQVIATASGAVTAAIQLTGSASDISAVTASLSTVIRLAAAAADVASASGSVTTGIALTGAPAGIATGSAVITDGSSSGSLAAAATATATSGATLTGTSKPASGCPGNGAESDSDLDAIFQSVISGVTAICGTLVRPRWQPVPPVQPEVNINWVAFGVVSITPDDGPYILHDSMLQGTDHYQRHEELEFLMSFYGPAGSQNAALLRDGLGIPQNLEPIEALQMGFVDAGPIRNVPELINQQWRRRWDCTFRFRRRVDRTYAVKNILAADIHLFDDSGHVDEFIDVTENPNDAE